MFDYTVVVHLVASARQGRVVVRQRIADRCMSIEDGLAFARQIAEEPVIYDGDDPIELSIRTVTVELDKTPYVTWQDQIRKATRREERRMQRS